MATFNPFLANYSFAEADTQTAKMKADCLKKASGEWNASLNRCVTKKENQALKEEYVNCASLTDKDQEKENTLRKDCFDKNALAMVGDLSTEKETLAALQKAAEALGYTQMIIEIIAKEGEKSDCNSAKANAAAGIVGMAVDIYLSFFVEDKVNELRDRYALNLTAKKMGEKGSYESQLEAFDYLEKEQNLLIDVDKKKTIAYGVATGIYGLALILAIYEMTPWGAAGACKMYSSSQSFMDDFKSAKPKGSATGAGDGPAGTASSSSKALDGASDTSKAMSSAGDAGKAMDSAGDAGKALDSAGDTGKAADAGSPGASPDFDGGGSKTPDIDVDVDSPTSKSGGSDKSVGDSSGTTKTDSSVGDSSGTNKTDSSVGDTGGTGQADASPDFDGGDSTPSKTGDSADTGKVADDAPGPSGDRGPSSTPDDVDAPSSGKSGDSDVSADVDSGKSADSAPDSSPPKQDGGDATADLGTDAPKGPDDVKKMKAEEMDSAMKDIDNDPNLSADQKTAKKGEMVDEFASRDTYQQNVNKRKPVKDMTKAELELEASEMYRGADSKKITNPDAADALKARQNAVDNQLGIARAKEGMEKVWSGIQKVGRPALGGFRMGPKALEHNKDGSMRMPSSTDEGGTNDSSDDSEESTDGENQRWNPNFIKESDQVNNLEKFEQQNPELTHMMKELFRGKFKGEAHKIENVLFLDKEFKAMVRGDRSSPNLSEYEDMLDSGLFTDSKEVGQFLQLILGHTRNIPGNIINLAFPKVMAQEVDNSDLENTESSTNKEKKSWDVIEGQDDTDYDAKKNARNEEKGKQAGIMIGIGAGAALGGMALSKVLDKIISPVVQKVRMFFSTSPGIAVIAGMGAGISGMMLGFALKEKAMLEANVKKIKKIKKGFEDAMVGSCPGKEDRENIQEPKCYCYTMAGKRNVKRTKSKTCKDYWAVFDRSRFIGASKYGSGRGKKRVGCATYNGQFDPNCKCRDHKNPSGKGNACYKLKINLATIGGIGKALPVGTLGRSINSLSSDAGSVGDLDYNDISRSAAKVTRASRKWLNKFNKMQKKNGKNGLDFSPKKMKKFSDKMNKTVRLPRLLQNLASGKGSAASRRPPNVEKEIKEKAKKEGLEEVLAYKSMKKPVKKKDKKKDDKKEEIWDFETGENKNKENFEEIVEKGFDYNAKKSNEIVKRESVSIFKIISNRYLHTGLKVLFKDDKDRKPSSK